MTGSPQTPTPSRSPLPVAWSPDSAGHDWPGPIRVDSTDDALHVDTLTLNEAARDALGDLADGAPPFVDIVHVSVMTGSGASEGRGNAVSIRLADVFASVPDPRESWVAYGIVLDIDGDFLPDQRIGVDNATGEGHREWVTSLASGETSAQAGPPWGHGGFGTSIDTWFFDEESTDASSEPIIGLHVSRVPRGLRFYAWASLIRDGLVIATDFAPNEGWLQTYEGPDPPN